MPSPNQALSTLRPDLGGSLEEFNLQADREGYIGHQVFPQIDVATKSDSYGVLPAERSCCVKRTRRVPKGGYSEDDFRFGEKSYACKEHGHIAKVDEAQARIYRRFFNAEVVATARARHKVLLAPSGGSPTRCLSTATPPSPAWR